MSSPPARWPRPFERSLLVLISAVSAASLVVGLVAVIQVYRVHSDGVHLQGTVLGAATAPGEVYVRFLVGDSAVLTTAESPTWTPPHGTRVTVGYLAADPAASVRIIDARASGGYPVGMAGIAAGAAGTVALGLAYRRSLVRQRHRCATADDCQRLSTQEETA